MLAQRLNRALFDAFNQWRANPQAPFFVPGLHAPGNQFGEGTGIFYHRPSADVEKAPGRRYHPSRLPRGLTQLVGHIGDKKTRELLGARPEDAKDGPLRHLTVNEDGSFAYAFGLPKATGPELATVIFLDGGMNRSAPEAYELYQRSTGSLAPRPPSGTMPVATKSN
jgi:hypothetical protein